MEFQGFQNAKADEYWITDEFISSINKVPENQEEAKDYFENLNTILKYQNEINEKKLEYWDEIDDYYRYLTWIWDIQKKYKEDFLIMKNYSEDLTKRWESINFDRSSKYGALISTDSKDIGKYAELWKDLENIWIIQEVLMNPASEDFPIFDVKNAEIEKKLKQERIDVNGENKKIGLVRIHIEEDAGKLNHDANRKRRLTHI